MNEEWFEVLDETGRVIGRRTRAECHRDPSLMHPVVHLIVVDARGRLFLQKRSATKVIQPGRWDTSVGGHMHPGETPEEAVRREAAEELGLRDIRPVPAYSYRWHSERETEWVHTYWIRHDGPFRLQADEMDDGRFWSPEEIRAGLGRGAFTPNFEYEFERWQALAAGREGPS